MCDENPKQIQDYRMSGEDAVRLPTIREEGQQHALANLRQSIWEVSQWLNYDEIQLFVLKVLREIDSDQP